MTAHGLNGQFTISAITGNGAAALTPESTPWQSIYTVRARCSLI